MRYICLLYTSIYSIIKEEKQRGATVIVATHHKEDLDELCDTISVSYTHLDVYKRQYKDSPIIILDEPTASLDPIAESEIYMKDVYKRQKMRSLSYKILVNLAKIDEVIYYRSIY